MAETDVGAVVLAAGKSRRFGGRKQLAVLAGRTLLEHALEHAHAAGLSPIVAVVPIWLTRPANWEAADLRWVRNPFPERGLSHSLRLGLAAMPEQVAAAVVLLGDQPRLAPGVIGAVVNARGEHPVVAAEAGGRLGHPVLLERSAFGLVEELSGDIGLREFLHAHAELVRRVPVNAHASDVDTPDDLARLRDG